MLYKIFFTLFLLSICISSCISSPVSYPAQRWQIDRDRNLIKKPKSNEQYRYTDVVEKHFFVPIERALDLGRYSQREALNLNNFDEVPDSTWFVNRIGRVNFSDKEIARGPDRLRPFKIYAPWVISKAKTHGVTPGFFIQDARGNRFLLKFEASAYAELASSVEVIGTKIFHALGYHVPENYIVEFDPKILKISEKATYKDNIGRKKKFTHFHLKKLLAKVEKNRQGRYRVLLSRYLDGIPLGPFKFTGRRPDDTNDRIPHEHRRELRGYRIFAAWLNHYDSREANSLDMFIPVSATSDKGYVKHYLIDLGSILGSNGNRRKTGKHLYDYNLRLDKVLAAFVSLGAYNDKIKGRHNPHHLELGNIGYQDFQVQSWRPMYHNPAFQNMTDADAFWAVKILSRFKKSHIQAIVQEAKYTKKKLSNLMADILMQRRKQILRYYFNKMTPMTDFELSQNKSTLTLRVTDLARLTGNQDLSISRIKLSRVAVSKKVLYLEPKLINETKSWIEFTFPKEYLSLTRQKDLTKLHIWAYHNGRNNYRQPIVLYFDNNSAKDFQIKLLGLRH